MTAIDLNGATVVVTGASRGFGRATAVALAKEFIERAGATATPGQVARRVVDLIADGSYSAPAYHLTSDGLRPLG
jgi:NAD(P)-dependent dehydrogenase (short-subunit alcohol dehydrogenase family)